MDAATVTYHDVYPLLCKICKNVRRAYGGGDWDELMAEASQVYVEAYQTYDYRLGDFSKRVAYMVWYRLTNQLRDRHRRNRGHKRVEHYMNAVPDHRRTGVLGLIREVSDDARTVVRLVLDGPEYRDGATGDKQRRALVQTLTNLGWAGARIAESFNEIRGML